MGKGIGRHIRSLHIHRWKGRVAERDSSISAAPGLPLRALSIPLPRRAVENEAHCDFVKLREMLIRVNMEDLREQTHSRHYELYRRCKLEEMGFKDTDPDSKPFRYPAGRPGTVPMGRRDPGTRT